MGRVFVVGYSRKMAFHKIHLTRKRKHEQKPIRFKRRQTLTRFLIIGNEMIKRLKRALKRKITLYSEKGIFL